MRTETLPWNSSGSFAPGLDFHDDGSWKPEPYKRKVNPRYPVDIPGARDSDWATGWMKGGCGCRDERQCSCGDERADFCCGACADGLPCAGGAPESDHAWIMRSIDHFPAGLMGHQSLSGAEQRDTGDIADCCILDMAPPNDPPLQPMSLGGRKAGVSLPSEPATCAAAGGVWNHELCPPPIPAPICGPDVTAWLAETISENVRKGRAYATYEHSVWGGRSGGRFTVIDWFEHHVKSDGDFNKHGDLAKMDFKECPIRCPDSVTLCGYHCVRDSTPEDINFSIVGRALGIKQWTLELGADLAQASGKDTPAAYAAFKIGYEIVQKTLQPTVADICKAIARAVRKPKDAEALLLDCEICKTRLPKPSSKRKLWADQTKEVFK